MNNPELVIVLIIGAVIMCVPIAVQMKWYGIVAWKSVVVSLALVVTGAIGSRVWYCVENGSFLGRSFYGAIFFAPIVFWPLSRILHISYGDVLDFCAPAGCLTLAMVKIQCFRDGCCDGIALFLDENHNYVLFPSQIVEMIVFLIIAGGLMALSSKKKYRKIIFPYFLLFYGGSRFVLDFLRDGTVPYALGLSAGSFWSLLAFVIGTVFLIIARHRRRKLVE